MSRIAVVPVRAAVLPAGAEETIAEAGGTVLLAGSGTADAAAGLAVDVRSVKTAEIGDPAFGAWAAALAPTLRSYRSVLLPASADGRDLAPRLAAAMDRPLLAGATEYRDGMIRLARRGGLVMTQVVADGPVVVTLQPGVRGIEPRQRDLPAPEPVTARVATRLQRDHDRAVRHHLRHDQAAAARQPCLAVPVLRRTSEQRPVHRRGQPGGQVTPVGRRRQQDRAVGGEDGGQRGRPAAEGRIADLRGEHRHRVDGQAGGRLTGA